MQIVSSIFVGLVAVEHLYILWLEMFAWETRGKKVFRGALPDHMFAPTRVLAANQGLYNGFLAAGLIWSFFIKDPAWSMQVRLLFLGFVIVAGTYGAYSADRKIFYVQAVPAIIAFLLVWLAN